MADKDPLADIRQRIDEIDAAVQQLVSERAGCARKVAEVKREQGDTEQHGQTEAIEQHRKKITGQAVGAEDVTVEAWRYRRCH